MSRNVFGWSLPPGCTFKMLDDQFANGPCLVCGQDPDDCICPECPVCGAFGDPACYDGADRPAHGLVRSFAQVALLAQAEQYWRDEEAEYDKYVNQLEVDRL